MSGLFMLADHSNPIEYYRDNQFKRRYRYYEENVLFLLDMFRSEVQQRMAQFSRQFSC